MKKKSKKEEYVPVLREELKLKDNDIIPQVGFQEAVLTSEANIMFIGGSRGAGKTFILLLDSLYDVHNPRFGAMFFRKETRELEKKGGVYDKATELYPLLGGKGTKLKYVFPSGAYVIFDHLQNENEKTIETRFKGLEVPGIYIDEVDQIEMKTFLMLMQSNRNSVGIRNRIIGSCNPAPDSWVRKFIEWYINDEGYIDPERDRKIRYFYTYGSTPDEVIWGDTQEQCYERAKNYIDAAWKPEFAESGLTKFSLLKSFTFIRGDVAENKILLRSDQAYLANIAAGGAASIARNLDGNWNVRADGSEMVSSAQMAYVFDEFRPLLRNGVKYISVDVALMGLDNLVAVIWDGDNIEDLRVKERVNSEEAIAFIRSLMIEYGVRESNLCYDAIGVGGTFSCFKNAVPIFAQSPPIGTDISYDNIKSQLLYTFGRSVIEGKISCSPDAAQKMFNHGKGTKKERLTFKEIMQTERRGLMIADSDGKTKMYNKKQMKAILGYSPDFLEAAVYKMVFNLMKKKSRGFVGLENL